MDTSYTSFKVDALLLLAARLSAHEKDNACAHQYSFELNIGTWKACPPRRISIEVPADNMEMWNWKTTESGRAAFPLFLRFPPTRLPYATMETQTKVFGTMRFFFLQTVRITYERKELLLYWICINKYRNNKNERRYTAVISAFGQLRVVPRVSEREMFQATTFSGSLAFAVLRALILVG